MLDYAPSKKKNPREDSTHAIMKVKIGKRIYFPLQLNVSAMTSVSEKYVDPTGGSTTLDLINALSIYLTIVKFILH